MVTRKEWYAENSTEEIPKLKISPAPYVIIAHTVTKECNTTDACKSIVRNIQAFHISMDYGDIGYNFLVGGDGEAYEGLGWDLHGAHTIPFNSRSIGLAFIGNFVNKVPPRQQIKAAQLLLEEGLRLNKLTPNYKIFGHKQIMATESPGQKLMEIIETWAHWAPYNAEIDDGGNGSLVMVGHQEWGEIAINESYHSLQHPTEYVLIAHTAGRLCQSLIECSYVVNYIQNKHIKERGFGDIAYNFLIGGDGRVYIGRDWDAQGRHTKPFNSKSIGIAFIGTFTTSLPPKRALRSAQLLLAKGVELGKLSENYTVYCQKQVIPTESPGLRLIQEIKRWPHWHTFDPQNDQPDYTSITPLHNI